MEPLWKAEHSAFLIECRNNGLSFAQSAAEINAAFDTSYTKNACISRAARLGLPKEERRVKAAGAPSPLAAPTEPRRKRAKPAIPAPLPDVPAPAIEPDEPMAIDCPAAPDGLITVLDLQKHHCRFPLGEAPYHFCGVQKREGFPYCAEHVAVTHNREVGR